MISILNVTRDSLTYMRQVAIHMMDYVDAVINYPLTYSPWKT